MQCCWQSCSKWEAGWEARGVLLSDSMILFLIPSCHERIETTYTKTLENKASVFKACAHIWNANSELDTTEFGVKS